MSPVDPGLKDAVWLLLEITAHQQPGQVIHSDFIVRRFPKINEIELLNAIGALVEEGKITVKASSVDAHGNATAYHISIRGSESLPPGAAPSGGIAEMSVGLGSGRVATPDRPARPDQSGKVDPDAETAKVSVRPVTGGAKEEPAPEPSQRDERLVVRAGRKSEDVAAALEAAEEHFADEVTSFFAEMDAVRTAREDDKKQLLDQLAVLMAMFQSADAENFTTPIAKLASLKNRVALVAPELVPDYILLCQTALRAWLWRA